MPKTRTTILIEKAILKEAQELGINVSKATENSLLLLIKAIKQANSGMGARLIICSETEEVSELPAAGQGIGNLEVAGSNPAPGIKEVDWESFHNWLLQNKKERVANDVLSYAKRFRHCLFNADLTEVASMNSGKRRMVMASLSNLAKFLGVYDQWKSTVRRFGIKWIEVGVKDKRMIDRLTKVVDADDVYNWVKQCKMEAPELTDFLDLMALTGMRLEEAVNSYNLIIKLANQGKLGEYYDAEKQALEHYKFKDLFLRKGKKAFVSFVPRNLIQRIVDNDPIASRHTVGKKVSKARFSDLREAHASILTRHLSQSEIDFLHGRIGTSVFMQNYFNPALIGDLKERVFKAIAEIEAKIA